MTSKLDRAADLGGNLYVDTRSANATPISFTEAVVAGLAPNGGLYIPEELPKLALDQILDLANLPYDKRAAYIYKAFNIDLPDERIDELMARSYGQNFDTPKICPITSLEGGAHVLELWHGPTSAFKDMALQCLPNYFSASAAKLRDEGKIDNTFFILVATSGDTGKAALEGFKGVDGIDVGVLYPRDGVSDIQRKQMVTTTGDNVYVWAVKGNFDDCQKSAKQTFNDVKFADELHSKHKVALSSANSINWGRLLPQVVYYVSAYSELVAHGKIQAGEKIDVCVPTGNFGNILACWYAKQMGTPIERLICASNENRVLTDFINTGIYDISDREFVLTPSPSMDILVSSNLERQLFELSGRDGNKIAQWMQELNEKKGFSIDADTLEKLKATFAADSISNEECLRTIKDVLNRYDYLIDPHTAVAYAVAQRQKQDRPVLVASTAHWAKFANNVYRAIHDIKAKDPLPSEVDALTGCELNDLIAKETGQFNIPKNLANLDNMEVRFDTVIDDGFKATEDAIVDFLDAR